MEGRYFQPIKQPSDNLMHCTWEKTAVQQAAQARGIPTFEEYEDNKEGWLRNQKTLLDPNDPTIEKSKTINGHRNCLGLRSRDYSPKNLLAVHKF